MDTKLDLGKLVVAFMFHVSSHCFCARRLETDEGQAKPGTPEELVEGSDEFNRRCKDFLEEAKRADEEEVAAESSELLIAEKGGGGE